jgi:hypothetical protein
MGEKSEYAKGFDAGRKAALQSKTSSSFGCACIFDEKGDLIVVCEAHARWLEKEIARELEV